MYYVIAVISVFAASLSQMLLKKGASVQHDSFVREYLNPWVAGGYALMSLTLVANIYAMSRGLKVKELGTIESLSYLFVPIMSFLFFKEKFTLKKLVSILIIIIGIIIFFWS